MFRREVNGHQSNESKWSIKLKGHCDNIVAKMIKRLLLI
jgi:hypothetical protein